MASIVVILAAVTCGCNKQHPLVPCVCNCIVQCLGSVIEAPACIDDLCTVVNGIVDGIDCIGEIPCGLAVIDLHELDRHDGNVYIPGHTCDAGSVIAGSPEDAANLGAMP